MKPGPQNGLDIGPLKGKGPLSFPSPSFLLCAQDLPLGTPEGELVGRAPEVSEGDSLHCHHVWLQVVGDPTQTELHSREDRHLQEKASRQGGLGGGGSLLWLKDRMKDLGSF